MPLDLFDDVLLKDLALETLERALQAFTIVNLNFSQRNSPRFLLNNSLKRNSSEAERQKGTARSRPKGMPRDVLACGCSGE